MTSLEHLFSLICGQVNCWTVAGRPLPLCQRCTGLYVGASVALALWMFFRPKPTNLLLWAHGLALLLMVPFGYHFVPQSGDIRSITGYLFGFGLVFFLMLVPASSRTVEASSGTHAFQNTTWYVAGTIVGAALLLCAVHAGGYLVANVVSWLAATGLAILAALVVANLLLGPISLMRPTAP